MKRTIKFRGRVRDENKARSDQDNLVYGNCLHQYPNGKIALSHTIKLALTFVAPESVAQFVGVDSDGNEVYEGDTLFTEIDGKRYEYVAGIESFARHPDGLIHFDLTRLTLKKEDTP